MAYPIDGTKVQKRGKTDGTTNDLTFTLPTLVQNDVFVFSFSLLNGTITSVSGDVSGTGGWSQQHSDTDGNYFYVYYSIVGATPDTSVTITCTSGNQDYSLAGFGIKDADVSASGANLIDGTAALKSASAISHTASAITPTNTDTLVIIACGMNSGTPTRPPEYMFDQGTMETTFRSFTSLNTTYQRSATSTGTFKYQIGNNGNAAAQFYTFGIKNASGGSIGGYVDKSVRPNEYLHLFLQDCYTGELGDNTEYDPTNVANENISSLNNGSYTTSGCLQHVGSSGIADVSEFGVESWAPFRPSGANGDMMLTGTGITQTYGSVDNYDLTNEKLIVNVRTSSYQMQGRNSIGVCFGLSDKTNAQFWHIGSIDSTPSTAEGMFPTIIDVSDSTFYMDEIGTFNENNVGSIIWGHEPDGNYVYIYPGAVSIMRYMTLVGGSSGVPCSFATAYKLARSAVLNTILSQGGMAVGQYTICHDIQIGGGDACYWDCTNESGEWPKSYDASAGFGNFKIGAAKLEFRVDASSGDTVNMSTGIFNFGNYHKFTIESTSHNSDIYTFTGRTILNATVTLQSLSNVDYGGLTFDSCKEITLNGADISGSATKGRVTISNGVDTNSIAALTGATQAAIQALVDGLANVTFLNNTTAVRIEYTGATNITINFDAVTWTGNTTDIHFNATNAVSLTANMQNGANASTTAISGSATGVTISNDVTFTITVNVSGAEITFLNRGTQTEVYHVETGSTTQGYTYTYSSDVDLDIQVFKQGYKPYWNDQETLTSSNQTVNVVLEDEPASQI